RFVRGVMRAPVTWQGDGAARTRVWLPSTGHPSEALRDASLRELLRRYPLAARFAVVRADDHPELFAEARDALGAGVVLRGRVVKGVVSPGQWAELLGEARTALPAEGSAAPPAIPLIDAHAHVADDDGAGRLVEAMDRAGVRHAVLAALVSDE